MNCPVCETKLPVLVALLAKTSVGTQCPQCWSRLHDLDKAPLLLRSRKKEREKEPPYRRAA